MTTSEQASTKDPEAADRHRFIVVGVYPDGRGIDPVNVSARDLHAVQAEVQRSGAQAVTTYLGEDTGRGPELVGLDSEQSPAPVKSRKKARK